MLKKERQQIIIDLLEQEKFLAFKDIYEKLNVSKMTIRRDIDELEQDNILIKLYGGVQLNETSEEHYIKSINEKIKTNVKEKKEIAKTMDSIIEEGSTIFLGAGTSMLFGAQALTKKNLTVITNNLIVFDYLEKNTNYKLILVGGTYNPLIGEFIGVEAENFFENININMTFTGTNGIFNNNITTSNTMGGKVIRKAFEKSQTNVVVADNTKFDIADIYTFCKLSDMDILITDSNISKKDEEKYKKLIKLIKRS